jgi:geranylgeranyl pyrophosphate synthase
MPDDWPTSREVHAAVAERVSALLEERGGVVADVGRRTLSLGSGVLSDHPHSMRTVLVPGTCLAAGGAWRAALWPTAAAECIMAAADVFDDVADADPGSSETDSPGVLLTAAAGLLALAGSAVVRVVRDGAPASTAVALADLLGAEFTDAANGQAASLGAAPGAADPLVAFYQAAAKSGPLGSLLARLGARTATEDGDVVNLLGEFGRRLAVREQLLNDARDAAPRPARHKSDVRVGARTVPLAFTGSAGAPAGLSDAEVSAWEERERTRVMAEGGLTAALALAEAERLGAAESLDRLESRGHNVSGLRALLS